MTTQERPLNNKNPIRSWLVLAGGLAILVVIAVLILGRFKPGGQDAGSTAVLQNTPLVLPAGGPPLQVGDLPYDFTLVDLEGNPNSLHEFIGRPLIINFWATWCAPCRIEMPHLQNTFETRQAEGLMLLALNQDEPEPQIEAFYEEFGLTFPALLDEGSKTAENFGVGRILPTTFFINARGEIIAIHRGPMTQAQIDGYLAQTMPGP